MSARSPVGRVVRIADLDIDDVDPGEVSRRVRAWLGEPTPSARRIVTPNADYVVKAHRDPDFRRAVNGADLRVPDGMWVVYASRIAGRPLHGTVTGRLLVPSLAEIAAGDRRSIALFGAPPGVAAEAARRLQRRHPDLRVTDAISPPMGLIPGSAADTLLVERLKADPPAILFVGLGAPRQELWMAHHVHDLPGTVMVGIGAGLDLVAGRFRTAPAWMTRVGLEWAFRLAQEPRRLARRYLVDDPWIIVWALRARVGRAP